MNILLKASISLLVIIVFFVVVLRFITNYHNHGLKNKKTIIPGIIMLVFFFLIKFFALSELLGTEELLYGKLKDFFELLKSSTHSLLH